MRKYIALKDNLARIFIQDKRQINQYTLKKESITWLIKHYQTFITVEISGIMIFYFFNEIGEKPFEDFIEVTSNKRFLLKNILQGSVTKLNLVIEGADGVGKSTIVKKLAEEGYLAQDRAVEEITKQMREEIPNDIRITRVREYLKTNIKRKVIFLYLSNVEELKKRIFSREKVSEYDKKAVIFQQLYLDTYTHLQNHNNLYLLDCSEKSPHQLLKEIKKLIEL